MTKQFLIFIGLLLALPQIAASQTSGQLGSFDFLPQTVYANPALRPKGRLNIGIPALSQIYAGHGNNWFVPKDYLISDGNGNTSLDANKILDHIDKSANIGINAGVEILHVGMRFGKSYINVRAAERVQASITLPKDIFNLAIYGNAGSYQFDNNTANFSDLNVDALHFREYALGYNYKLNEKWSFGLTAKYLYGMERVQTKNSSLRLHTDPTNYALSTSGSFLVNTSGIAGAFSDGEDIHSDIKTYLLGLKNTGFGMDIGAAYSPIEKLRLEFSANDIGYIKWKTDLANYGTNNAEFAFNGIDLTDFIFIEGSDFNDAFQHRLDSLLNDLENTYNFQKTTNGFSTSLNGYFRYAATYELYKVKKLSGSAWANVYHGIGASTIPFSFALGYNQKVGNWLQAGLHFSKQSNYSGSFGAGISLNAGFFQIYCLAENFHFAQLTRITISDKNNPSNETKLVYFSNPQDIRINVGVNLTFGMKKDDKPKGRPMKR